MHGVKVDVAACSMRVVRVGDGTGSLWGDVGLSASERRQKRNSGVPSHRSGNPTSPF